MGCTQSGSKNREPVNSVSLPKSNRRSMNPLSELEIQDRIDASKQTQILEIDGIKMRFAFMSQRGYYPECKFFINIANSPRELRLIKNSVSCSFG